MSKQESLASTIQGVYVVVRGWGGEVEEEGWEVGRGDGSEVKQGRRPVQHPCHLSRRLYNEMSTTSVQNELSHTTALVVTCLSSCNSKLTNV